VFYPILPHGEVHGDLTLAAMNNQGAVHRYDTGKFLSGMYTGYLTDGQLDYQCAIIGDSQDDSMQELLHLTLNLMISEYSYMYKPHLKNKKTHVFITSLNGKMRITLYNCHLCNWYHFCEFTNQSKAYYYYCDCGEKKMTLRSVKNRMRSILLVKQRRSLIARSILSYAESIKNGKKIENSFIINKNELKTTNQ
jgi:hypothetical protein